MIGASQGRRLRTGVTSANAALQQRWQRMPLRTRLTAIAAAAVALAVIAVSVAAILLIRDQLHSQFDRELRDQASGAARSDDTIAILIGRGSSPWDNEQDVPLLQIIEKDFDGDYTVKVPIDQSAQLPVNSSDRKVLTGAKDVSYQDVKVGEERYRMVTVPTRNGVLQFARQPIGVEQSLATLTLLLIVIGAAGVVGAALLGRTVARAGLAPVDRLTAATEHVAATQDLNAAIAVTGDDEVARLGRAFNAMLAALDASESGPAAAGRGRQPRAAHPADQPADQHRAAAPGRGTVRQRTESAAGRPGPAAPRPGWPDDRADPSDQRTRRAGPERCQRRAGRGPGLVRTSWWRRWSGPGCGCRPCGSRPTSARRR